MKKYVAVAMVAILAILAMPARSTFAAGATTQTVHVTTDTDVIPLTCAGPFTGVTLINATGNGVVHDTANTTGDWFTTTFTGIGTITMLPTGTTYDGKVTEWFGAEDNNQNGVQHGTLEFHGTSVADPTQTLDVHATFDVTMNANGMPTASHFTVKCH